MKSRVLGALAGLPKNREHCIAAWITFDGSGTTIFDQHNISSYTNNASAGDWTITMGTRQATDYAVAGLARWDGGANTALFGGNNVSPTFPTAVSFRLGLVDQATGSAVDGTYVAAAVVGPN